MMARSSGPRVGLGAAILIAAVALAAFPLWQWYHDHTTNTVEAYFSETLALYPGDKVQIMGLKVGQIDTIEPAGDKMKVVFHYSSKYKIPAKAIAAVLNPSLVASRVIQLAPAYEGGPALGHHAVIPIERTRVPVEYDQLRDSLSRILSDLGPTTTQAKGPFGDAIESVADGLSGKGAQINTALRSLSEALSTLNEGSGDLFGVIRSLAQFVDALYKNDKQYVALNDQLARFTGAFTNTDEEVANTLHRFSDLLGAARTFVEQDGPGLTKDIDNLAEVTNAILAPEPRDGLETALHVLPNLGANLANIYAPAQGALTAVPVVNNFANPMQLLCSAIQAGSRMGYQDSAELCAQYLAPILDAIKFNHLPFGANLLSTTQTLPNEIAYSESRLQPPPGFKDTTVPGIWARDTLFSHGNHESGWIAAPGMQGTPVQPSTQAMLNPDSLAELLGGPDAGPPRDPRPDVLPAEADPAKAASAGTPPSGRN